MKFGRPRYADVAATLALVLAMGTGGAYAAGKITGKQIAKNAITSPKIKNGTIQTADIAAGSRSYSPWDTIPSGQTVTGRIYDVGTGAATDYRVYNVNLPAVAPSNLDYTKVNFAADASSKTMDDDATCTGTYFAPTAPPGKLCIYPDIAGGGIVNVQSVQGNGWGDVHQQKYAFFLSWSVEANGMWAFWASWAYTAP